MKLKALFIIVAIAVTAIAALLFRPKEYAVQGRTMSDWLQALSNSNSAGKPLQLIQVTEDTTSHDIHAEVALSYDLLKEHEFLGANGKAKFDVIVNGNMDSSYDLTRAANGNLIVGCDSRKFRFGSNQLQIAFFIFNPLDIEGFLRATSSISRITWTNNY